MGHFPLPFIPLRSGKLTSFIASFSRIQICVSNDLYVFSPGRNILCYRAPASAVSKISWKRSAPLRESIPLELHSDQDNHFTEPVIQSVCKIQSILQHFHCAYHSLSSGVLKPTNAVIKFQFAKLIQSVNLPWPQALPWHCSP